MLPYMDMIGKKGSCNYFGCMELIKKRGYCESHYRKLLYRGLIPRVSIYDGRAKHPLRITWNMMHQRCENPNASRYKNYGARGIKVCDRWSGVDGFWNFVEDMGERPEGTTLERIDNDGNYEPNNCKWSTYGEQNVNRKPIRNKSGCVGVSWDVRLSKWRVVFCRDRIVEELGYYTDINQAIEIRRAREKDYGRKIIPKHSR